MPGRYSTIIRTLAREADEAARTKANQQEAIVLQALQSTRIKTLDQQSRRAYVQKLFEYTFPKSSEYLNRQLDKRLVNLPFLKRPEPTGVAIDEDVEHNRQLDEFAKAFEEGEADAICDYFELVLQCSIYPDGFHKNPRIAYANESRQLVVDYQLPTVDRSYRRLKGIRA
jgi:hypothetical protein